MARRAVARPWWTVPGGEICSFCLQAYHYEVALRCTGCDRPLCPSCTRRVTVLEAIEIRCPDCPDEADEEA